MEFAEVASVVAAMKKLTARKDKYMVRPGIYSTSHTGA
jgi:hypothetical protein